MSPTPVVLALSLLSLSALGQYQQPPEGAVRVYQEEDSRSEERYEQIYRDQDPSEYRADRRQYQETPEEIQSEQRPQYSHDQYKQQNPHRHAHRPEMEQQYAYTLKHSQGTCDLKQNPHSYGCTEWTFKNNSVFPLFQMDWNALQGEWFTVTYVGARPNANDIFAMGINPRSPGQPMGVINTSDSTMVGKMIVEGRRVTITNWNGHRVSSDPESFKFIDRYTVRFDIWLGAGKRRTLHTFHCRDFNRNDKHHLLCDWLERTTSSRGEYVWVKIGYIGFLGMSDWENFKRHGAR